MSEDQIKDLTPDELIEIVDKAIENFSGNVDKLESAIGLLMLARKTGWKPAYLFHSRSTVKDYEKILDIQFQKLFPPEGPKANKSIAWKLAKSVSNFWKAVKGEIPNMRSTELVK